MEYGEQPPLDPSMFVDLSKDPEQKTIREFLGEEFGQEMAENIWYHIGHMGC